ncbi:MAG: PIN domain-containing protein [Betaproteobacteria bacterium]|nr:PIN domain-containing protein [Betaproteobacteria bacterium]
MSVTAVDASAIAAVLFMEPEGAALLPRLSGRLIAPLLLPYELANVCRQKTRRQPDLATAWLERFRALPGVGIELLPNDFDTLPELAAQHGLTAYDAAYLQLALGLRAPLVTLDAKLALAWTKASAR